MFTSFWRATNTSGCSLRQRCSHVVAALGAPMPMKLGSIALRRRPAALVEPLPFPGNNALVVTLEGLARILAMPGALLWVPVVVEEAFGQILGGLGPADEPGLPVLHGFGQPGDRKYHRGHALRLRLE